MTDKSDLPPFPSNPHLAELNPDKLYHIGYSTDDDLKQLFGDVKFVCMGGSTTRMANFAALVQKSLADVPGVRDAQSPCPPENISRSDRYVMYKIGPVLSVNHGMGFSSVSILLHEIIKLLYYAGCDDPVIIRIGTSGGIGIAPGTVVVTKQPFNAEIQPHHNVIVAGKVAQRESYMDEKTRKDIIACGQRLDDVSVVAGNTMSTDDFYEGQGRLDGAVCKTDLATKMAFLEQAKDKGIVNIEMECVVMGALCHTSRVRCACVCVTLLNRLNGDQVNMTKEQHDRYQAHPQQVVIAYMRSVLTGEANGDEPSAKKSRL
ncbi:uridine phosphorylase 1-like [Sycon ciliatum]|uniref:uridine phosphorylase 1-like n=1 Tax=Sycon ciliatum TaxID=27933 RepID=UPI0031F60620